MEYVVNALTVGVVLGLLVFIHEFGHYAAAKLCGVRVEVFSIGFGKRLLGFKRGETDYRLSVLPLGGYVKMSGENPFEASTGDPGEFMSHPRWQRFIIAIAGPFMNVLLAVAVMTGMYMVHYPHADYENQAAVIGWIQDNSPADKAKLEVGDKIVKFEGIQNPSWDQITPREAMSAGQPLHLQIQRGMRLFDQVIIPLAVDRNQRGQIGWDPHQREASPRDLHPRRQRVHHHGEPSSRTHEWRQEISNGRRPGSLGAFRQAAFWAGVGSVAQIQPRKFFADFRDVEEDGAAKGVYQADVEPSRHGTGAGRSSTPGKLVLASVLHCPYQLELGDF